MTQADARRFVLSLAAAATLVSTTFAQEQRPQATQPSQQQKSDLPAFDEVTKDMEALPGLMTFYRYKAADVTKDQTRLLAVVPKALLKQDLLFAISISRGNLAGFQWSDGLVRWEQVGRQLKLVAPDTRYVDNPKSAINEAVVRTYRPSFVFALPVVTTTPQGDPVVDLGQALFSPAPLVRLPNIAPDAFVRREISRVDQVKSFPDNALVDLDLAIGSRTGIGGQTLGMSVAFRRLPAAGAYQPRAADDRIGYFQTTRQDWNTKYSEREMVDRFVNRWDLKKKDPSLEMSPPEQPITFIVDKSVPLQWRRYVADGVLEWNKAFEKVGIVGAIVVQQQTDDNEFAGIDPADARYNFVQWTVRNQVLAVGPSRPDPRTGQILDADIVIDDSWIRYFNEHGETFAPKAMAAMLGADTLDFLEKNPAFIPPGMTVDQIKSARQTFGTELMGNADETPPVMSPKAMQQCQIAIGLVQQLSIAQMAVAADQAKAGGLPKVPDSVIGSALKHLTMHEVGHTLGLRHNFKASSWLPLETIKQKRDAGEAFVGSVMDYNPMAFFASDDIAKIKSFSSDTIGPYDYWAITYGYGSPAENEKPKDFLKRVTSESTKREHAYATDEDTAGLVSPDPSTNVYDLGDNPAAWAKSEIDLTNKLLANIQDWAQKPDEPNYYMRDAYGMLMYERARNLSYVSRLIGGQYFSRARPGDPNAPAPLMPVDPKQQREALDLINKTILSEAFYKTDPALLNRLTPSRFWDSDDRFPQARIDFPYYQMVESQYGPVILRLCSPQTLQRVYDAEVKSTSDDKLTAAEVIKGVRDTVWSELAPGKAVPEKIEITPIRRGIQNTHLQYLLAIADSDPQARLVSGDVRNMVRYALRDLSKRIGEAKDKTTDFAVVAHLEEARSRIDRTLNKPLVSAPSSGAPVIIMHGQTAGQQSSEK